MYGYLNIESETLNENEKGLYQTFMCGLCLSSKKLFGNLNRITLSNDINILNILFHSITNKDINIYFDKCLLSPIKKRPLMVPDAITDFLSVCNIALLYAKIYDNVIDDNSIIYRIYLNSLKKSYSKAKKLEGDIISDIELSNKALLKLEKNKSNNIDEIAHPFGELTKNISINILNDNSNKNTENLCYNIGKWIYLIDALDDLKDDYNKKSFNPFIQNFKFKDSINNLVKENYEDLQFLFYSILNNIAGIYNDLGIKKYVCILNNIFYKSMRNKTESIFNKYLT